MSSFAHAAHRSRGPCPGRGLAAEARGIAHKVLRDPQCGMHAANREDLCEA